jgi:hypothetical protein
MRSAHEGRLEATDAAGARAKVQLDEIGDLLRESRRLMTEGGSDSQWAAYLQRKSDLLDRLAEESHVVPAGESL